MIDTTSHGCGRDMSHLGLHTPSVQISFQEVSWSVAYSSRLNHAPGKRHDTHIGWSLSETALVYELEWWPTKPRSEWTVRD